MLLPPGYDGSIMENDRNCPGSRSHPVRLGYCIWSYRALASPMMRLRHSPRDANHFFIHLLITANDPSVSEHRSDGASSISSLRRPALMKMVAKAVAEASITVASFLFCPKGLIPLSTYPVNFSASCAPAMAASYGSGPSMPVKKTSDNPYGSAHTIVISSAPGVNFSPPSAVTRKVFSTPTRPIPSKPFLGSTARIMFA